MAKLTKRVVDAAESREKDYVNSAVQSMRFDPAGISGVSLKERSRWS